MSAPGVAMQKQEIACPRCGAPIEITEALAAPVVAQMRVQIEADTKKKYEELAKQSKVEARSTVELEMKALADDVAATKKKLAEAQKNELELRQARSKLEEEKQALALEVQRQLDVEKTKVREQAQKELAEQQKLKDEQQRLKDVEKDKLNSDLKQQVAELTRKLEQGSQQTQGEVQELDLEARLRVEFPSDLIEPVAKGQRGADCVQRVVSPAGLVAGAILWECKRTKAWSEGWLAKLREDQRDAKCEVAVLLTQTLPKEVERFGFQGNVWITDAASALPLTIALRQSLLAVASTRQASTGQRTKMELLYGYLTGSDFRHRVEAIVDAFTAQKEDLDRERTWLTKQWAKREKEIARVVENTVGLVGDLQGIAGKALPEIEGLEPKELGDGEDDATSR